MRMKFWFSFKFLETMQILGRRRPLTLRHARTNSDSSAKEVLLSTEPYQTWRIGLGRGYFACFWCDSRFVVLCMFGGVESQDVLALS